jgi:hypothetical protein
MTRQQARYEARKLSKLWVGTRLRGPRIIRQKLVTQLVDANWKAIQCRSASTVTTATEPG